MEETATRSVAEEDAIIEAAIIRCLLAEYPTQFTEAELVRELGDKPLDVKDAVRRLARVGLLHEGEFVVPTRAALHMDRLPID